MATSLANVDGKGKLDIFCVQGDTVTIPFTISTDGSPSVVDKSSYTCKAWVKKNYSDTNPLLVFSVDDTDSGTGTFIISLSSEQTASLPVTNAAFSFVYDVQLQSGGSPQIVTTYLRGNLKVFREVTNNG